MAQIGSKLLTVKRCQVDPTPRHEGMHFLSRRHCYLRLRADMDSTVRRQRRQNAITKQRKANTSATGGQQPFHSTLLEQPSTVFDFYKIDPIGVWA